MVKVLIYSSKEIYDNAPFEGRAESDIIAYKAEPTRYKIMKCRVDNFMLSDIVSYPALKRIIELSERDEWEKDKKSHELVKKYKSHPFIELMKNE